MNAAGPAGRADRQRNRRRLLEAAEAVIGRDGAQASLEEIARRAGVGSATLHRHFPSRHDLLNAVFHEGVERLSRRAQALADSLAPGDALAAWLEEVTTYTATTRGLATALMSAPECAVAAEDSCHGLIHDAATRLVTDAEEAGVLRTEATTHDLMTLTNAISVASDGDPDSARRLLRLTLGGVLKSPPAEHPPLSRAAASAR
ncbi:helix-turn-helix domain-containing protein [Nonomuraea sp. NPDC048901]|uniref:TetR/AcrR family transcriptional regulator n=1 Tax=Nonomuraea sp. NPDC048901 TaxID=3155627 RepID=UPI0033C82B60